MIHHNTKLGCKRFRKNFRMLFLEDLGPHCDLDLEVRKQNFTHDTQWYTNIPSFIRKVQWFRRYCLYKWHIPWRFEPSLWPLPQHEQSKIVTQHSRWWWCTTIPSLAAKGLKLQVIFVEDLGPHCNLDLEDRNPNILHDNPGHDDAPTYQVSLRNDEWFRRYIFPEDLNPQCDLEREASNQKLSHKKLWNVMVYHYTKCGSKSFRSSGDMEENSFWGFDPTMHNHTKFHEERLRGWEDIVWTNIGRGFGPSLWPWPWKTAI